MKTSYLFPNRFKAVSGIAFIIFLSLLIFYINFYDEKIYQIRSKVFAIITNDGLMGDTRYFRVIETIITDEILMLIVIVSGIIYAFSKEKHEDEFVASIRLHSLAWSTILNYGILLFCYTFIHGLPFFNILMAAMFSQLVIFIVLFRIKMHTFNTLAHEEYN